MNEKAWEAVEHSAAFGIELHNQTYAALRKTAATAIANAGFSEDDVRKAGDELNRTEAEIAKKQAEVRAHNRNNKMLEHEQDKQYQLLVTAALSYLPRYDNYHQKFDVPDQKTLQALADTVLWLDAPDVSGRTWRTEWGETLGPVYKKYPFYVLGYKYSDNSVLVAPPLPALFELKGKLQQVGISYNCFTKQRKEVKDDYWSSREVTVPRLAIYRPERKDRKHLQAYMQQDIHLIPPEQLASHYDRTQKNYQFSKSSDIAYVADGGKKDRSTGFRYIQMAPIFFDEKIFPQTANTFSDYGILDLGLVRLMTHFDQGDAYLGFLQAAKNDYLVNIVYAEEQRFKQLTKAA